MRFKVLKEVYPKGDAYYVVTEQSGKKIASTYKDETMAFHLADSANLVHEMLRTGLYHKVINAIKRIDEMNGANDAT